MAEPNPNTPDLSPDSVIPSVSVTADPNAIADTHGALDAMYSKMVPDDKSTDAPPKTEEALPKKEETPPPKTEEVPPKTEETPPKEEETPAKKEDETPPQDNITDFEKVELGPYAKPSTAQAFATVKTLAKVKIDGLIKERDEIAAKLTDTEGKVGKLPAETEQELKELRTFRQRFDVEYDPSFLQFDTRVKQNEESILGKLKEANTPDDVIAKIREIGVEKLEWDSVLEKLPSNIKRFIENKLFANDDLRDQKERAVDSAKKNADKFLEERNKSAEKESQAVQAQVKTDFTELFNKFPWSQRKTAAATATAEEKAGIEAHNKFLDGVEDAIKDSAEDGTPHMRAVLTLGYVRGLYLQRELAALNAGQAVQQKAWDADKAKLQATIDEQQALIDKVKKSSSASRHSVAAVPGQLSKASADEHGGDALDRHRAETTVQ